MHLAGRLVYQREHHAERDITMFLQKFRSKRKAMIGEIVAEHSCQMQVFPIVTIHLVHTIGNRLCQSYQQLLVLIEKRLNKTWYYTEIHFFTLRKGLHWIEHATTSRGQHIHMKATCRVNKELVLTSLS